MQLHGTADAAVAWTGSGSRNGSVPATLDDTARWAVRMGCSGKVQQTYNDGTFSNLLWSDCTGGTQVEFMTVRNGVVPTEIRRSHCHSLIVIFAHELIA